MKELSKLPIYAALMANVGIAVIKFIAAYFSNSASMLSEGIHSTIDSCSELLLLFGIKRSKRPSDIDHPFGYGKEIYFWALIVSILIFTTGGCASIYEGITHITHPYPFRNPLWNYIVLGTAACFEGGSFMIALRKFREHMGNNSLWEELRLSKDPTLFSIIYEDGAALIGLSIAFIATFLGHSLHLRYADGTGSVLIGILLMTVSFIMIRESRNLLLGESADTVMVNEIFDMVNKDPDVFTLRRPVTMHLSPGEILLAIDIQFHKDIRSQDLAKIINRLEMEIRRKFPQVNRIYLEARNLVHSA